MSSSPGRTKRRASATLPANSATPSSLVNGERSASRSSKMRSTHLLFGSVLLT